MEFETAIYEKQVKIAELQAEAEKARQLKHSEADAASRVIAAKAESDAMQYTLAAQAETDRAIAPGSAGAQGSHRGKRRSRRRIQSHRQQSRSRAPPRPGRRRCRYRAPQRRRQRRHHSLNAAANADTIRLTAAADAERLQGEAAVLKQNPMLIQKIIAERLSDKLQIIMVPTDGRNFFASDVLRSAFSGGLPSGAADDTEPDGPAPARKQAQIVKSK